MAKFTIFFSPITGAIEFYASQISVLVDALVTLRYRVFEFGFRWRARVKVIIVLDEALQKNNPYLLWHPNCASQLMLQLTLSIFM